MPRIFVAIPLPAGVAAALADVLPRDLPGLRRVDAALLHFTLAFIGQVPEQQVSGVRTAVETAVRGSEPFAVALDSVGRSPESGRIRIVWGGASAAAARIERLGAAVRAELGRRRLPFDPRPLWAHVTLARVRDEASADDARSIVAAVEAARVPEGLEFAAGAVHVMESRLSSKGPLYSSRARIPLTGPAR